MNLFINYTTIPPKTKTGLAGFLLGYLLDKWGWGAWTYMLMPFSLVGAILMLVLWNATPQRAQLKVVPKTT